MKWLSVRKEVLCFTGLLLGVLLLLSSALWIALASNLPSDTPLLLSYDASLIYVVAIICLALWFRRTRATLVPRVYLLGAFLGWFIAVLISTIITDPATQFYWRLLEAPLLFVALLLLAHRVITVFAPSARKIWFYIPSVLLGTLTVLVATSTLHVTVTMVESFVRFVYGPIYTAIIASGFILLTIAVVYIPLGRRQYPSTPTISLGKLTFATAPKAQDVNLPNIIERLSYETRRLALKRGQWLHLKNNLYKNNGVVSTDPKACESACQTLFEYALHKSQSQTIVVALYDDPQHPYLHVTIEYVVNKHAKSEFTTYSKQFKNLGGVLTIQRSDKLTTLIISFPVHW